MEDLTPDQRAKVEAARAEWNTPENRADEEAIRGMIEVEFPPALPDPALRRVIDELKAARTLQGLTLQQLQDRTGIDRATYSRLESGKSPNPTWSTLQCYASAIGITLQIEMKLGRVLQASENGGPSDGLVYFKLQLNQLVNHLIRGYDQTSAFRNPSFARHELQEVRSFLKDYLEDLVETDEEETNLPNVRQ